MVIHDKDGRPAANIPLGRNRATLSVPRRQPGNISGFDRSGNRTTRPKIVARYSDAWIFNFLFNRIRARSL